MFSKHERKVARGETAPPAEYERPEDFAPVKIEPDGTSRDAIIAAARTYDQQQRQIAELEELLRRAGAEVAAAAHQIDELKLSLATERNHVQSYKAERDEAVRDHACLLAILANVRTLIDDEEIEKFRARRRNGKTSVVGDGPLPDPVIDGPAVP